MPMRSGRSYLFDTSLIHASGSRGPSGDRMWCSNGIQYTARSSGDPFLPKNLDQKLRQAARSGNTGRRRRANARPSLPHPEASPAHLSQSESARLPQVTLGSVWHNFTAPFRQMQVVAFTLHQRKRIRDVDEGERGRPQPSDRCNRACGQSTTRNGHAGCL